MVKMRDIKIKNWRESGHVCEGEHKGLFCERQHEGLNTLNLSEVKINNKIIRDAEK